MSFDFNYKLWVDTKKDIRHLIKRQNVLKKKEPIEDPTITFQILSQIYILYIELVCKLAYLYKKTFQVQKKDVIKNLIVPCAQRLLELKNALKNIELSEYVYLDKSMIRRKLTPYDMLIWRSDNLMYSRPLETQAFLLERETFFMTEMNNKKSCKSVVDAITKIQSYERARQARLYKCAVEYNEKNKKINIGKKVTYSFNHKIDQLFLIPVKRTVFSTNFIKSMCRQLMDTENLQESQTGGDGYNVEQLETSALKIQMAWKSYKAKKMLKMKKKIKNSLYGMRKAKKLSNTQESKHNNFIFYQNDLKKSILDKEYVQLMTDERSRLLEEYKGQIMEDISDHIREWFREFYEKTEDFHPYPDALNSGTVLALIDETMNIQEFKEYLQTQGLSKEEKKKLKEKLKLEKKKEKEKIKKEKLKEKKRQKKMKDAGIFDIGQEFQTNKNIIKIEETISQFSIDWKNVDEYLNKQHEAIKEWVTENELVIIHKELRSLVDEYMRIEYDLLKTAWSVDNKKKYKPSMPKKVKNVKEKKIKKTKDLTADRTIESLYEELRKSEIIENNPKKYFEDFLGDFNILADDLRNENNLVTLDPGKADIKMVLQDIMFGMGSLNVGKPKAVCLVGPENIGKKLLCNIIASELVIGCIDGTHFGLQKPPNEHMFFNKKGFHSLNSMIICYHKYKILAINSKYGLATHDSFVWKESEKRIHLEQEYNNNLRNVWLLSDSEYPCEPWLLTPYSNPQENSMESRFNDIHSKARCIVERTIGILKARWKILCHDKRSRYSAAKIAQFSNVCTALHNICIHFKLLNYEDVQQTPLDTEMPEIDTGTETQINGKKIRDNIKIS